MKTDDEMYQSVLSRYNDYQQKKKHRIIITRRIVSLAACFVAIFSGYQIWNKISATPPQIPIIEETTETTFNPVTTTKADTTVTTEKTTETTADTTTATITSDNLTANITQTTAVSSAVQSTAVNTDETVTTAVHTENTTALQTTVSASIVQSSINTTYVNTNASPLITTIDTNNAPIIETSITDCSPYQSTTITTNITQTIITTVTTDIPFGALFEFNGITYMHKGESIDKQMLSEKIGEYNGISIYSVKKYISEIQIALDMNEDYYYIFDNINYYADNLKQFIDSTDFSEGYSIRYRGYIFDSSEIDDAVAKFILEEAEYAESIKLPDFLDNNYVIAYGNDYNVFFRLYKNGYLECYLLNRIYYYNIGEERAYSFFEYLKQKYEEVIL